jgi:hypothetical protein
MTTAEFTKYVQQVWKDVALVYPFTPVQVEKAFDKLIGHWSRLCELELEFLRGVKELEAVNGLTFDTEASRKRYVGSTDQGQRLELIAVVFKRLEIHSILLSAKRKRDRSEWQNQKGR